jgi:hypothetical protein
VRQKRKCSRPIFLCVPLCPLWLRAVVVVPPCASVSSVVKLAVAVCARSADLAPNRLTSAAGMRLLARNPRLKHQLVERNLPSTYVLPALQHSL